jgi:hypothetical protein
VARAKPKACPWDAQEGSRLKALLHPNSICHSERSEESLFSENAFPLIFLRSLPGFKGEEKDKEIK